MVCIKSLFLLHFFSVLLKHLITLGLELAIFMIEHFGSRVHSFNKYLLSAYSVLSTVLGTEFQQLKQHQQSLPHGACILVAGASAGYSTRFDLEGRKGSSAVSPEDLTDADLAFRS